MVSWAAMKKTATAATLIQAAEDWGKMGVFCRNERAQTGKVAGYAEIERQGLIRRFSRAA